MKDIRYDAEGDILYVTFEDANGQTTAFVGLDRKVLFAYEVN